MTHRRSRAARIEPGRAEQGLAFPGHAEAIGQPLEGEFSLLHGDPLGDLLALPLRAFEVDLPFGVNPERNALLAERRDAPAEQVQGRADRIPGLPGRDVLSFEFRSELGMV